MPSKITRIVSGAQTGADRAALDFAIESGLATGGYVPKGRLAEDGTIPAKYAGLIETATTDPSKRTELNVIHSDATLIVSHGDLNGGAKITHQCALKHKKSVFHIDLEKISWEDAIANTRGWIATTGCSTLNIAGARLSEDPAIYDDVINFLRLLFAHD